MGGRLWGRCMTLYLYTHAKDHRRMGMLTGLIARSDGGGPTYHSL